MKMAEWIRMMCNGSQVRTGSGPERNGDVEGRTSEDAARTPRVSMERRRTDSRRGRESRGVNTKTRMDQPNDNGVDSVQVDIPTSTVVRHTATSDWHTCL